MSRTGNILAISALIGGATLASQAQAERLFPGQYSLGGIQNVCIQGGGTWYSSTFSGWAGEWTFDGRVMVIFGNYLGGVGNDVIEIIGGAATGGASDWTEWRDGFSFANFLDDVRWTFEKSLCDPPAADAVAHLGVQATTLSNPSKPAK